MRSLPPSRNEPDSTTAPAGSQKRDTDPELQFDVDFSIGYTSRLL